VVYQGNYDLVGAAATYFGGKAARLFDRSGRDFSNVIARIF
jgi:hypothetical protein